MNPSLLRSALALCLFLFAGSLFAQSADDAWDDRFDLPGVVGTVYGSALDSDGKLYILGDIVKENGLSRAQTLIEWDGSRWNDLGISGDSIEINGKWYHLLFTEKLMATIGKTLYVAARLDNYYRSCILALDANGWRVVGGVFNDRILALATHGSTLYVAGNFELIGNSSISGIAQWNGSVWESVGEKLNGKVTTLTADRFGTVYITGNFNRAGSTPVSYGAMWNAGTGWSSFGDEDRNRTMTRLTVVGTTLFGLAREGRNTLYRLEGTAWKEKSAEVEAGYSIELVNLAQDSIGSLYITATSRDNSSGNSFLFRLNGNTWSRMEGEFNGPIYTVTPGKGEQIFVGGGFGSVIGGTALNHITEWNGTAWRPLLTDGTKDDGLSGEVASVEWNGPYLYAGGTDLISMNLTGRHGILRRQETGDWERLGTGVEGSVGAILNNPAGGIYVGGCFNRAGDIDASNVAWWDGTAWHRIGSGPGFCVADLALAGETLYAVGGTSLAKWDGRVWTLLANDIAGEALSVAAADNGTIYVGGYFDRAGTVPANNIARWKNGEWSALQEGLRYNNVSGIHPGADHGVVRVLTLDGTDLYAGGIFDSAGSTEAYNIARWNGTAWSDMYTGLNGGTKMPYTLPDFIHPPEVRDIRVTEEYIFVGGHFHTAGKSWGTSPNIPYETGSGIVFWDKREKIWQPVGTGINAHPSLPATVRSIAVKGNQLWLGGSFTGAATRPSFNVAFTTIPSSFIDQPNNVAGIDFGAVPIGAYKDSLLLITNPATSTRTLSGTAQIVEGPFSLSGVRFGVAPGKTVSIPVRFSPAAVGFVTGRGIIRYNTTAGPQEQSVPLWGNGLPPIVGYYSGPDNIEFGSLLQQNSTVSREIVVGNRSSSTQSISITANSPGAPFSVGLPYQPGNPLGTFTLAPGEELVYEVVADLRVPGDYNTVLTIGHNANSGGAITIPIHLRVTGRVATMNVTPNPIDFGDVRVGEKPAISVTVENDGGSNIPLTFVSATTADPFRINQGNFQRELNPGRQHTFTVSFAPASEGPFASNIEITRIIDGASTIVRIPVRGNGVSGVISPLISPTEIDFGSVAVGRPKTIQLSITNQKGATLPFRIEYGALEDPFSIAEPGSHTIQPQSAQTYAVRFAPVGIDTYRDTIFVVHNAPGLPNPFPIPVRGESRLSGVEDDAAIVAGDTWLSAEPNPAVGKTLIRFRADRSTHALLSILALDGRRVAQLLNAPVEAGEQSVEWDTEDQPPGVYLCVLTIGGATATMRVVVR